MGYYSYSKKIMLKTTDGGIFLLALYMDSNVRERKIGKLGQDVWYHPKHWAIINPINGGVLIPGEDEWNKATELKLRHEMELSSAPICGLKRTAATLDSTCYFGTRYPAGRTYRAMKKFFSTNSTKPASEWIPNHPFRVFLSWKNDDGIDEKRCFKISSEDDLMNLATTYNQISKMDSENRKPVYHSVEFLSEP